MLVPAKTPSTSKDVIATTCTGGTRSSWWVWLGGRGHTTTPTSAHWDSSPGLALSGEEDCTMSA